MINLNNFFSSFIPSIKFCITNLLSLFFIPLTYLLPKGNIIILGTYSRNRYCENTKYLYEYLHNKKEFKVFWITDNKEIMNHLDQLSMNYIGFRSPLKMLWICLRAKMVIDSGTKPFDLFNILSTQKTIKITTLHGNGPKANFSRFHPPDNNRIAIQQIESHYQFDFVNYPSEYSAIKVARRNHLLPNEKIISLGYPRCDNFFDEEYSKERLQKKEIVKTICPKYIDGSKIIFYTPTWRPYDFCFPLNLMDGLDLDIFNSWLEDRNLYFFFSIHTAHYPENIPNTFNRIIYINTDEMPLFDTNAFMLEVDILLNDYATTSTEFALLNRPQLFFMPDYDYYEVEKGFVEDYKALLVGDEVKNFTQFKEILNQILLDEVKYISKFAKNRNELLCKYYDLDDGSSSYRFYSFIKKILIS